MTVAEDGPHLDSFLEKKVQVLEEFSLGASNENIYIKDT